MIECENQLSVKYDYGRNFSIVTYAPIIESKPNDMSTVYTTMKKCVDMTKAMSQKYSVQTFDPQAVNEEALSSSCTDLSCDLFIFV
jgi:hypothetical protein